ncbi:alpha/beta-hydrolase [Aaosphaeria arxii CBS 175.79]|uniref:Alpha/beta-hydrolase n=1 Tax=Aaosphaeria arxii CBS 175.79 TaxID=1450172 RepID=A0A6A5XL53_9PLEO|nr:alpha/beta-hydrolase [Aaosphaeria arxii CBS 175.79]KAF2013872.1 alpha/beta-hydrolase [Aaosphaeria arxii CBS 175.79]
MSNSKPVIIFIPGAWHPPECFAPTTKLLSNAGYTVDLIHSALLDPPENDVPTTYFPDVERIQARMREAISKGYKVVLFAHSFGGLSASAAIEGFEEHVQHLILCAAWLLPKGSAPTAFGPDPPWFKLNENKTLVLPVNPQQRFYHDVPEKEAEKAIASLKPFAYLPLTTVTPFEGYRAVPTTYIMCTQDQALSLEVQEMQVRVFAKDSGINTVKLDSSHSPFFSMPSKVAEVIAGLVGREQSQI